MNLEIGLDFLVELGEELPELRYPVAAVEGADHLAGGDLKGCEEGGGAGPDVVVAAAFGANARQILETVDCDMPVAAAIDLVDQWVAFFGVS